jgi:Co/Zn/Cd efflux system component
MLGDSATMFVDAFTYLFNMSAEKKKDAGGCSELERCRLELVSPSISVIALLSVTVYISYDAILRLIAVETTTTVETESGKDDDGDAKSDVMLGFAVANLILDLGSMLAFTRSWKCLCRDKNDEQGTYECQGDDDDVSKNMNMSSAYTHVIADTLRSIAVLVAAVVAMTTDISSDTTDAVAALAVSGIIAITVIPLLVGLWGTWKKYRALLAESAGEVDTRELLRDLDGSTESVSSLPRPSS